MSFAEYIDDDIGIMRYGEAVKSMRLTEEHVLGRPVYAKRLSRVIIPGKSYSPDLAHVLHVLSLPLKTEEYGLQHIRKIHLPTSMTCGSMIEPDLLVMACGRSHSILNLSPLFRSNGEETPDYAVKSFLWHLEDITTLTSNLGTAGPPLIASGANDGQVYVCDLTHFGTSRFPAPVASHSIGPQRIQNLKFHPTNRHLLSWTTDHGFLQFFDARLSKVVASVHVLEQPMFVSDHALYNTDCILGFGDGMVQIFDIRTMMPKKSFREKNFVAITQVDIHHANSASSNGKHDLIAFYGAGFLAYDAGAFCASTRHPKRAFDFPFTRNERLQGVAVSWSSDPKNPRSLSSNNNIIATTNTGLVKSIDISKI